MRYITIMLDSTDYGKLRKRANPSESIPAAATRLLRDALNPIEKKVKRLEQLQPTKGKGSGRR